MSDLVRDATCKDLNCVCYDCPERPNCQTRKCIGRILHPHCEGFYVCAERNVDRIKQGKFPEEGG